MFDASFSYIDEIMRQRSRGHIALVFHHHNITSMDADSIENIVFTKSKVVKILTFYRQSKCVKKAVFALCFYFPMIFLFLSIFQNIVSTYRSLIEKTVEREISKKYAPKSKPVKIFYTMY